MSEARSQCRITETDEDAQIFDWIKRATAIVEGRARRQLITATWQLKLDAWPCEPFIAVPRPPLLTVTSIAYTDTSGSSQTWASSNYIVDAASEPGRVALAYGASWPSARSIVSAITITYTAGYGAASAVPATFKGAIYHLVEFFNEFRGDEEPPLGVLKVVDSMLEVESVGDLISLS